jgi:hypothetical protein
MFPNGLMDAQGIRVLPGIAAAFQADARGVEDAVHVSEEASSYAYCSLKSC